VNAKLPTMDELTRLVTGNVDTFILAGVILVLALCAYLLMRLVVMRVVMRIIRHTRSKWDDALADRKVLVVLAWMAPVLVIQAGLESFPESYDALGNLVSAIFTFQVVILLTRMLTAGHDVYQTLPVSRIRPIKGYVQLVKLFVYILGGILAILTLVDASPWGLLSGIGAVTAVLLLVFKDTILSVVASIQIAAYDLVREGDWIVSEHYGADGDVVDMSLHTVKVQNWDKTLVSIPTYKLIDESFKNYRGMYQARGRRIKRAVLIDQSSVRFLTNEEMERLGRIGLIKDYVAKRRGEIEAWNREHGADRGQSPVNGRAMTNIGTFRAYLEAYIRSLPRIRKDLTLMVRQLAPAGDSGLPLEIYCFTDTTVWTEYESIQADIFDHLIASLPEFGLRAYQRVAQADRRKPGQ
jgi:miniconductance mechanosensitive channel